MGPPVSDPSKPRRLLVVLFVNSGYTRYHTPGKPTRRLPAASALLPPTASQAHGERRRRPTVADDPRRRYGAREAPPGALLRMPNAGTKNSPPSPPPTPCKHTVEHLPCATNPPLFSCLCRRWRPPVGLPYPRTFRCWAMDVLIIRCMQVKTRLKCQVEDGAMVLLTIKSWQRRFVFHAILRIYMPCQKILLRRC